MFFITGVVFLTIFVAIITFVIGLMFTTRIWFPFVLSFFSSLVAYSVALRNAFTIQFWMPAYRFVNLQQYTYYNFSAFFFIASICIIIIVSFLNIGAGLLDNEEFSIWK